MIIDILKEAILANIGVLRPAPKNWQKSCCRLCHTRGHGKDIRHRFGIQFNPDSIVDSARHIQRGKSYLNHLNFF